MDWLGTDGELGHWALENLEHPDIAPAAHKGPVAACKECED